MIKQVSAVLAIVLVVSACEGRGDKEVVGGVAGAALGGLLGSQIGGGKGQLAAVALGALGGAFLGSELGKSLDKADRAYMERNAQNALEYSPSNQTSAWKNPDSGHSGTFTPVATVSDSSGRPCRTFEQTVVMDGETERVTGRACRRADGTWELINS